MEEWLKAQGYSDEQVTQIMGRVEGEVSTAKNEVESNLTKTIAEKEEALTNLNRRIEELSKNNNSAELEKKLNEAIKSQTELVSKHKKEIEELKSSYNNEKIGYAVKNVFSKLPINEVVPESLRTIALDNISSSITSANTITKEGKHFVKSGSDEVSLSDYITKRAKELSLIVEETPPTNSPLDKPNKKQETSPTTQAAAMLMFSQELKAKGYEQGSALYDQELTKMWRENKINELPKK